MYKPCNKLFMPRGMHATKLETKLEFLHAGADNFEWGYAIEGGRRTSSKTLIIRDWGFNMRVIVSDI